jgi:beta-galactosidase
MNIINMRRVIVTIMAVVATIGMSAQVRKTVNLNFGWEFRLNNEGEWRSINLPHDFQIEQPWVAPAADEKADNTDVAANIKSRLSSRGFKEMGKGYYRYQLTPTDEMKGKRILLDFGGIMYTGDVFLNGKRIGRTDYGYVGFEIDITDQLQWGKANELAVTADTREPNNSRWYTGGGLIRDVKLVVTSKDLYFARHPLYITTRDNRFVSISAEFTNYTKAKAIDMRVKVTAPDGQVVYEGKSTRQRNMPTRTLVNQVPEIEIQNPQLWDTEHPNLYTVEATLLREDGTVADEASSQFGIRTIEFGPAFGMKLNGKKVLLKGYANHHTLGALGAANYPRAIEKRLQLMKQFGINHIRTSHNPYSREFIELCDKYGILVVDELYDKWTRQHTGGRVAFEQLWQYDVPEWVKRDRNSPSVVMWSLGNELQQDPNQPFNDFGVTMYKLMKTLLHRYDSTRLVTVAMHPRYRNWDTDSLPCELAKVTDIQAYNYRYMYFPGDGRRFPWMTFYQSEASIAAMGPNFFEMDLDKVIGLAYWGAIDYLGESQGWPAKGWTQGVFDISLEPKPKAYFMRSFFVPDEPMVSIAIIDKKGDMMWNGVQTGNDGMSSHWNRQPGKELQLITYTNADEVELKLNGKSLGRKKNPKNDPKQRNLIKWDGIKFAEGTLLAIAYNNGKDVAHHQIQTTGKAVKLSALADNIEWKADGMDLMHVRVEAIDRKGWRVPMAQDELFFEVEGDAQIVAVTNGDINSEELNVQNHRRLWNGSAMVILRAGRNPSKVILRTKAKGFKTITTKLETK